MTQHLIFSSTSRTENQIIIKTVGCWVVAILTGCNRCTTKDDSFQFKLKIDSDFVLLPVEERGVNSGCK